MKILTTLPLIALLGAGAAYAQDTTIDLTDPSTLLRSEDLEGADLYSVETGIDQGTFGNTQYTAIATEWDDIGEIEDVVFDMNGKIVAVVAEFGGFLDIGDHEVMLPIEDVAVVPGDNRDDVAFITRYSQEELKNLPEVEDNFWR